MKEAFEFQDSYEFRIPPVTSRERGARIAKMAMMDPKTQEMIENFQKRHNL